MIMWTHFEYTDGSNPYIAMTDKEAKRIFRKYKRIGIEVERIGESRYLIHNKQKPIPFI